MKRRRRVGKDKKKVMGTNEEGGEWESREKGKREEGMRRNEGKREGNVREKVKE